MTHPQTVIAQAGHRHLTELSRVLARHRIDSAIVCPPGENANH